MITTCRCRSLREVVIREALRQVKAMLPENEAQRLNALRRYQILDNPSEPAFDRIAGTRNTDRVREFPNPAPSLPT